MDVAAWLNALGLGEYARAFVANDIDADILPTLTAEDLRELGVTSLGHRKRLLAAIAELSHGDGGAGAQQAGRGPPSAPAAEGERRQVTVLFADLAGYTRLSRELDAEEVHGLLGRFFEVADRAIEDHGGTIDKHIGDCVMAVFGAPVAHGNDAERAASAALVIRDAMPDLARAVGRAVDVHIGVASGQVVASGTGSASHREYTVTGDSVNLASRLTDHAAAGEILISEAVGRVLPERYRRGPPGALAVEGLAAPVRACRLLGLRDAAGPGGGGRRPLVGRRGEVQQFRAALAASRDDGCGQTILVRGEAGIGKTRLVEEVQREAKALGFACHTGLVLDFGAGTGQDAVRSLVRSLLGVAPDAGRGDAVREAAGRALRDGLLAEDRAVFLNDLLDLPQPGELRGVYDAMDNPSRNRGKRETVAALVERVSRRRPLLLVVEDLHWADPLTLEHLARLTETVADCPALLVMTTRIEGDPIDQTWRSKVAGSPLVTVDLGPLRRQDALALATAFIDSADQFAERCIERAAGNPLFLEQLLRHAEETAGLGVPGSVQSLVQARVDRLEPADRQAVQAAAVFGQRFSLAALRHLIGSPNYTCDGLVRHFLVRPQGEEFLFAHALVRDGVYDSLLRSRRRELHRRAAAWFEGRGDPALRAEHLDRAEDPEAPRAYLGAARAQVGDYHYERALKLVGRGLELADEPADAVALTLLRGEILHDLGSIGEARTAFEAALAAARDDAGRCRAWLGLAAVKRITDDLDGAFADLERAESAAASADLKAERARIHFLRGNLYFPRGGIEGCLDQHQRSLDLAREFGSPELEAQALGGLGDAEYVRGRMITAHDRFRRCVDLAREHGHGRIEVANLGMVAHTSLYFRPQPEALELALAGAEAAARVGHLRGEVNARLAAFFALYEMAELDRGREQVGAALDLLRRLGARRFETSCRLYLGRIALAEGDRAEAVDLLKQALAISRETGVSFHGPNVLGALALATDDADERKRVLAEAEALLAGGCVSHNYLRFYPDAMDAALALGDWSEAERYAAALEGYAHAEPLPWTAFSAARGRALAAYGRGRRDAATLGELERLRGEAGRLGLATARQAIDGALAAG